jgi:hypothetical protein
MKRIGHDRSVMVAIRHTMGHHGYGSIQTGDCVTLFWAAPNPDPSGLERSGNRAEAL